MQYIKSNSALLAFDSSPAFSTGEKLGLFFASVLQDVEFTITPPRTQNKQIGSQEYGVNSINFSPDVITNISYLSRQDFETDMLLGALFRPSGTFLPVFSGARNYSFNTYLFFSNLQSYDLIRQIVDQDSFSGINVLAFGNSYLTNLSIGMQAGEIPRTSCSFISSNLTSESLTENYMQIPAINLESGTTGGAARIFLDPRQVSRIETGSATGFLLKTWGANFQPSFENLQIPNQQLSGESQASISSMDISLSIDRENAYGFGSDHVFGRDIKYPIQGSIGINGIVSHYHTGDFVALMENERKYNIEIYNRDVQDIFLSGASNAVLSGLEKVDHLTKNRWLKFNNCILREKKDSLATNGIFEFSNQFDFAATENGGVKFKQGGEETIDDVYIHSSDFHRMVSRDGYTPIHNPFLQYYGEDCSAINLLSSDKYILMTRDNFIEGDEVQACPYSLPSGLFASYVSTDGSLNSFWFKSGFSSNFVFLGYPSFVENSGELINGARMYYNYTSLTSPSYSAIVSGEYEDTTDTGIYSGYWYKSNEHKYKYSRESGVHNLQYNFESLPALTGLPEIIGYGYNVNSLISGIVIPTIPSNNTITLDFTSGGHRLVRVEYAADSAQSWSGFTDRNYASAILVSYAAGTLTGNSVYWFRPIGIRGAERVTGNITGYINPRSYPSGLYFNEGSSTTDGEGTLNWTTPLAPALFQSFDVYRRVSGVGLPTYLGSTTSYSYTDSTMTNPDIYEFKVITRITGAVSPTGRATSVYIQSI